MATAIPLRRLREDAADSEIVGVNNFVFSVRHLPGTFDFRAAAKCDRGSYGATRFKGLGRILLSIQQTDSKRV